MPFTVKLMRSPLAVEFEVGSIEEGLGILQDSKDKFRELLEFSSELGGSADEAVTTAIAAAPGSETPEAPARRGRGKGKNAAEAVAPAPLPVPGAAAPVLNGEVLPPLDATPNANGIPKFLDRTAPAAAAPPPPPLMPSAPPVAPALPAAPQFILGNKIANDLQKRLDGSADKGDALLAWLMPHATAFVGQPNASIEEVISLIRFTADDKVAHLASPLGIS